MARFIDPFEPGAFDIAREPTCRVEKARDVIVPADDQSWCGDPGGSRAKIGLRQCLTGQRISFALRFLQRCTYVPNGFCVIDDGLWREPDLQKAVHERFDTRAARHRRAFRPHGTQLVGVARCGVDEDETIDYVWPGGREVLRDKAAKGNACDVRARYFMPGKQFAKLSR